MNAALATLAVALTLTLPADALAQSAMDAKPAKPAATSPKPPAQRTFASPQEAVQALVDAVKAGDAKALLLVVGPQSRSWLFSGDEVADRADWKHFAEAYEKKNMLKPEGDGRAILTVGEDDFPFAAPIVQKAGKWAFDADAGREEITNRRIGRNELDTIQTLLAIVDAQREYVAANPEGHKPAVYAERLLSSPGRKDGLYWQAKPGEPQSPLGPLAAKAVTEGYGGKGGTGKPQPFHGYFFRVLKKQGKDAPGGAYDYVVNGRLFGGFAVLAYPAKYGVSGVMTFVVNHDGVVYEKDLGPSTAADATKITAFNPDKTWTKSPGQ